MKLRMKISILIVTVSFFLLVTLYFVSSQVILNGFVEIEEDQMKTNIHRAQNALKDRLENLRSVGGDWAPWDDTRDFVSGKNAEYTANNLTPETLVNLHLDFMAFFDNSQQLVHLSFLDPDSREAVEAPPQLMSDLLSKKYLF